MRQLEREKPKRARAKTRAPSRSQVGELSHVRMMFASANIVRIVLGYADMHSTSLPHASKNTYRLRVIWVTVLRMITPTHCVIYVSRAHRGFRESRERMLELLVAD